MDRTVRDLGDDAVTPYYSDDFVTLYNADVLAALKAMPAGSVHCVVTSPPYWGLRDYGAEGQIGLEATPEEYVAKLVEVFSEVRRVLRDDGTLWLNLGDSYAASGSAPPQGRERLPPTHTGDVAHDLFTPSRGGQLPRPPGLKPKDLVGIPWRVAFALQADGWVLRSEIIWGKPNPMPESVRDRPTKAHEQVFLLSKAVWRGPKRGAFAGISNEDARWLALLFDTEGNIVIKRAERGDRTQYGAQIAFANTSRDLLERARAIVGAGTIHERSGKNAPVFYWQMVGRQARHLLHRIYPYLIVKQRQAAVAIHMQDECRRPQKRPGGRRTAEHEAFLERCWQTVKMLNRFGEPDLSWVPDPAYGRWDSQPYFYDADAVAEPGVEPDRQRSDRIGGANGHTVRHSPGGVMGATVTRNRRTVWTITTKPYPEAHFAVFPPELPEVCIKAGTSEQGCCPECGAPWERIRERVSTGKRYAVGKSKAKNDAGLVTGFSGYDDGSSAPVFKTTGWLPTCDCEQHEDEPGEHIDRPEEITDRWVYQPIPCTVLDPFAGSGTTLDVARHLRRRAVGIELGADYCRLIEKRCAQGVLNL